MAIRTKIIEVHRITCPYCLVGAGEVRVELTGDSVTIQDMHHPIKCGSCRNYFKLKPHLKIEGVMMPEHDILQHTKVGELTNGR